MVKAQLANIQLAVFQHVHSCEKRLLLGTLLLHLAFLAPICLVMH